MRIAVFADNHANPYSTSAVLKAISNTGNYDAVVAAGDICSFGSDPVACVDMIRDFSVRSVYGNADEFVFAAPEEPPSEMYRALWEQTSRGSKWAAEKLGEERLNWLRDLPLDLRFSPTGEDKDDLLVVHANPKDSFTHIAPNEEIQKKLFSSVHQADDDPQLAKLFEGVEAAVMAHGHFHYTCERTLFGILLVNVSPCSFSRYDSDRRARFSIFDWDGEWKVERRYVEYDYRQEWKAIMGSDMPDKELRAKPFE